MKENLMTRKHQMYRKSILLLLCPLLFACGGKKVADPANTDSQNGLVTFHLNAPPSKVEPLLLSELADSVSYVALETTKETLTKDAVQYGDRYYTIINEERLLCFDKNGKFLHQIGRKGQGPEEYPWMDCYSFKVDPTNNWVYITSDESYTKVYNEEGRYVKTLTGEMWLFIPCFIYNSLAYFMRHYSPFKILDTRDNQIVKNNIEMEYRTKFWTEFADKVEKEKKKWYHNGEGSNYVSYLSNDRIYYWTVYYDTVMMAKGKEVKPYCRIIPKNKYKPEDLYGDYKSTLLQPMILRMYVFNDKILLSVRYYASEEERNEFYYENNMKYCYWVVCDLKDGSVTYHANYIINDLDGGPNLISINYYPVFDVRDIYSLNVEDLKNDQEIYNSYFTDGVKAKLKDQDGKFQRLLEPLSDDANPIIRTIYWKE
ncbi:MAG: 6-bladed beta-propeller [Bacteroidales bacterium]|nr:6-bladed beta-propeller [Bacteroidales bacterium]